MAIDIMGLESKIRRPRPHAVYFRGIMRRKLQHITLCAVNRTHYPPSRQYLDCASGTRFVFMLPRHNSSTGNRRGPI
jgi:hypothetical protein